MPRVAAEEGASTYAQNCAVVLPKAKVLLTTDGFPIISSDGDKIVTGPRSAGMSVATTTVNGKYFSSSSSAALAYDIGLTARASAYGTGGTGCKIVLLPRLYVNGVQDPSADYNAHYVRLLWTGFRENLSTALADP